MANQFTKGTRTAQDEQTRDKIRAEILSKRLEKYAKAKGKAIQKYHMEPAQVAAAKVLIERGKPALQAVTQVIHEEPTTEGEIMAQLRALLPALLADPGTRAQIQAMLDGKPAPVDATQQEKTRAA